MGSLYTYRVVDKEYYELIPVAEGTAAPAEGTNFDVQQAYKTGATLNDAQKYVVTQPGYWKYDVQPAKVPNDPSANLTISISQSPTEDTHYTFSYNDHGTPFDLADDYYSPKLLASADAPHAEGAIVTITANANVGNYSYIVTATWSRRVGSWKSVNAGVANMFVDDTQNYFHNYANGNHGSDKYYIEDDAVVFMYNNKMDTYQVVKGSDLEGYEEANVQWAFTGGNQKNGNIWVDLAYISVEDNLTKPWSMPMWTATPTASSARPATVSMTTVGVILAGGETVTLTSKEYARENDADLMRLYHALKEEGIYQLIVDGTTLIDVKDYSPAAQYTVTSALYNSMLGLNRTNYFVTSDTIFIPVSGDAESIDAIQTGETVRAVVDTVDHEVLAVIY